MSETAMIFWLGIFMGIVGKMLVDQLVKFLKWAAG